MSRNKRGSNEAKKKATKKTPVKKAATKATAPKETGPNVKKGDIVRAYNKNFLVESVSKKNGTLRGTHLTYVESRIQTDLSREIGFDEVYTVWHKGK